MRSHQHQVTLMVVILLILLTACAPTTSQPEAQATEVTTGPSATSTPQAPTVTATTPPSATPTVEPSATPSPLPTSTPTPAESSIKEIFDNISPSVAFIETEDGTGSGVLIEEGYLVTNAHVVWPYNEVRVVFPDGTEFADAHVQFWDMMLDLAVIGPLDTTITPVEIDTDPELEIASDVYLIGYPGEAEEFPSPTISRGLISRLRKWEPLDATYIQTDATVAGGQSGGVLVSKEGKVVGISGFFFVESFALVLSASDVTPRVEDMIAGEDVDGLGDRTMPTEGGKTSHGFKLANEREHRAFVITEPKDTIVEIEARSQNDVFIGVMDTTGTTYEFVDNGTIGSESVEFTIETEAPHFVILAQRDEEAGYALVISSHELIPLDDPDDGRMISIGETIAANIDYIFDVDYFTIHLPKDAIIEITVNSIFIDPIVSASYPGASEYEILSDDDSGGGLFDTDARLIYKAPHSGQYFITVVDSLNALIGGYHLSVAEAPPDATPAAPSIEPTPSLVQVESDYGLMAVYQSEQYPFSIQYPATWEEQDLQVENYTAVFANEEGGLFVIAEEDTVALGLGRMSLKDYTDLIISSVKSRTPGYTLESRKPTIVDGARFAEILEFSAFDGEFYTTRFIYIHESRIAFSATYVATTELYEKLQPMIEYSFDTFTVTE